MTEVLLAAKYQPAMAQKIPAKYRDRQKKRFRHCGEGVGHFFRHMGFIFAFGDVASG